MTVCVNAVSGKSDHRYGFSINETQREESESRRLKNDLTCTRKKSRLNYAYFSRSSYKSFSYQ